MILRAVVVGTGFAGKGHTAALRACGVDVVGMCGRTPVVLNKVANKLGIPERSTDLQAILDRLKPDIVTIGTPGGAHVDAVVRAVEGGAHVYCDKPLAASAAAARQLYLVAAQRRVKTCYGASQMYNPSVRTLAAMIQQGQLGEIREIECMSHPNLNPLIPHGWSHEIAEGGGRLNNNFTHKLAIVASLVPCRITRVWGETRNDMRVAPDTGSTHDFRTRGELAPSEDELDGVRWKEVDSDWSYTVSLNLAPLNVSLGSQVTVLFKHGALVPAFVPDHVVVHGSRASAAIEGVYGQGRLFLYNSARQEWDEAPALPEESQDAWANGDVVVRNWTMQVCEFVRDVSGKGHEPYLTFRDGWLFQEVIERVRADASDSDFEFSSESVLIEVHE